MNINVKNINVIELKEMLDNDDISIIDVREDEELSTGKISSKAIHIPLSSKSLSYDLVDAIVGITKSNKKVAINCKSGGRSMMACVKAQGDIEELLKEGQLKDLKNIESIDILNVEGGIDAWTRNGYDVS